jgi:hypothetical protein
MLQLEWFAMMRNRRNGVGSSEEEYADDMAAQDMGMGDMSVGDMGKQVLYVFMSYLLAWCFSSLMTPSFLIRNTRSPRGKCPEKTTVAILRAKIKLQEKESCRLFCRVYRVVNL